jgi:ATP phosphoribosyltransferase
MDNITIALAKGRLADSSLERLEKQGIASSVDKSSRKLIFKDDNTKMTYIFVKPSDVITYVEKGVADLGIVGKDVIEESGGDIYEIMDLGFGKCKFSIAGYASQPVYKKNGTLRIASKYPNVVQKVFAERNQKVEVIKLNGSVELAPILNLSDVIVDIVETGNTLKANGLVVLEDLMDVSARLIANRVSYRFKYEAIKNIEKMLGGE